jgi:phytoene synthase
MEVSQSLQTGRTNDPVVADALNLMSDCRIEPQIPQELINGLLTDLDEVELKTVDELLRYCYRVAGTVGLMMSDVLDVKDPAASPFAIDLGIGMQLTNICRDVQEDARMGRRYIPNEIVGKISLDDLINPSAGQQERLRNALYFLLNLADDYYESGQNGLPYLPLRARHGILIAAKVYHAIGLKLRSRDYRYWDGRVVIPKTQKLGITFMALGGTVFDSGFWTKPVTHRPELHRALQALPRVDTRHAI